MWYAGKSPTWWRFTCSDERGKSHRFPIQLIWTCARRNKGIVKIWCMHNPYGYVCTMVTVRNTTHAGMLHWIQVSVQTVRKKQWWKLDSTKTGIMRKPLCLRVCLHVCWTYACRGCYENKLHLTSFLLLPLKYGIRPGLEQRTHLPLNSPRGPYQKHRRTESWFGIAWAKYLGPTSASLLSLWMRPSKPLQSLLQPFPFPLSYPSGWKCHTSGDSSLVQVNGPWSFM